MILRHAILAVSALAIAACSSPQGARERMQARVAERVLEREGTIGEPGRVAAADFRMAREAREQGQWSVLRSYAASDAIIHGRNGVFPADSFLRAQASNAVPANLWGPNTVWTSCDGSLAVTQGRFEEPSGLVGSYVTVWERQRDNSYEWTYDFAVHDDPQPAPEAEPDVPEDAIVVPGLTSIRGHIADCPVRGESFPIAPIAQRTGVNSPTPVWSDDRTLRWHWSHGADNARSFSLLWRRNGEWEEATTLSAPAPTAD
ncbi:hypothetical protein [Aurantiacibacter gangjinensis]|uniref:hypothetical protein n=1 Tax=Aurantiacibacter gangjinensis TaxID=502682 RepID=UPI000903AC3E|nr:hypothetical protein [Aurantiacibacter gangjinensis]APE27201.1 hypothetical protein BMF35_a0372 [Aurantiacibacter gangjinensis]